MVYQQYDMRAAHGLIGLLSDMECAFSCFGKLFSQLQRRWRQNSEPQSGHFEIIRPRGVHCPGPVLPQWWRVVFVPFNLANPSYGRQMCVHGAFYIHFTTASGVHTGIKVV